MASRTWKVLFTATAVAFACVPAPPDVPGTSPTAVLRALPTSGDAVLTVAFDGSGSFDYEGPIAAHAWNYGDGASGSGVTAQHAFTAPGDYEVVLTVTDGSGDTGTARVTLHVTQAGNVAPVASAGATPSSGDAPLAVTFSGAASTDADGTLVHYAWDFGDGSSGTGASVSHVFATPGNYTATLTVTDDGNSSSSDTVAVAVMNQGNRLPTAAISAAPTFGAAPLSVAFDGSGSADADGTLVSYAWSFGDGATATGATASHTYAADGIYSATLVVTDDLGGTAGAAETIRVQSTASVIVDHTSLAQFGQIPDGYVTAAAQLRSLFVHASVGGTIQNGMRCLAGELDTRPACAALSEPKYSYANWTWLPHSRGGCEGKLLDLREAAASQTSYDVYHQKFCYFEGLDDIGCCANYDACVAGCAGGTSCIQSCETTFQASLQSALDLYTSTLDELAATYPSKTFVWWTIPYAIVGERCAHDFNQRLRAHALANGKILFDIAAIEAHDPSGGLVTLDGRESVHPYYCGEFKSNQGAVSCHPDLPYDVSWDSDTTIETACGEGGQIRLAKAWWVLMARIAGWQP